MREEKCVMCVRSIICVVNLEDLVKNFHLIFCTQIKQYLIYKIARHLCY